MSWTALAHQADDPLSFRRQVLERIRETVPWDLAMFHALSPRVPLETGVFVGATPDALFGESWDRLAVDLGRFIHVAMERRGVASDTEVVPRTGRLRQRFREVFEQQGVFHVVFAHLVFQGTVNAVIVLGRTRTRPFTEAQTDWLRDQLPPITLGDATHQLAAQRSWPRQPVSPVCADDRLTPRQQEIVTLVARGHTNQEIGTALGLSPNTIRNRLADAFRRLQVASRAELVHRASFAGGGV